MKLKGISEDGIRRLARVVGQQEPDYGEGDTKKVKAALEKTGATWYDKGWEIIGELDLDSCQLTRLPKIMYISGRLLCSNNQLTSFEGAPKSIGGNFNCANNKLRSLEGAPIHVWGNFSCFDNPGKFSIKDVKAICEVKGEIFADYDDDDDEVKLDKIKSDDVVLNDKQIEEIARKFLKFNVDWVEEEVDDGIANWIIEIATESGFDEEQINDEFVDIIYSIKDNIIDGKSLSKYDESMIQVARILLSREDDFASEMYDERGATWYDIIGEITDGLSEEQIEDMDFMDSLLDEINNKVVKIIGI